MPPFQDFIQDSCFLAVLFVATQVGAVERAVTALEGVKCPWQKKSLVV